MFDRSPEHVLSLRQVSQNPTTSIFEPGDGSQFAGGAANPPPGSSGGDVRSAPETETGILEYAPDDIDAPPMRLDCDLRRGKDGTASDHDKLRPGPGDTPQDLSPEACRLRCPRCSVW